MNKLAVIPTGSLEQFDPGRYRLYDAAVDFGIEEAKRIQDWPKLEEAIDLKLEEQRKFFVWWNANVTPGKGWGSENLKTGTAVLSLRDAEALTGMKQQRVSELGKKLAKGEKYREDLLGSAYRAAMLVALDNVRGGTGENEWYTPQEHLELARSALGEIDLDPASHPVAQERVRAKKFFTEEDDGLTQEWHGRVWLNPPYSRELIPAFVSKMVAEYASGRVSEAIMLTHNYTDTEWFHEAARACSAICFPRGRIRFELKGEEKTAPTQGQAFFYFGERTEAFCEVFNAIGFVMNGRSRTIK